MARCGWCSYQPFLLSFLYGPFSLNPLPDLVLRWSLRTHSSKKKLNHIYLSRVAVQMVVTRRAPVPPAPTSRTHSTQPIPRVKGTAYSNVIEPPDGLATPGNGAAKGDVNFDSQPVTAQEAVCVHLFAARLPSDIFCDILPFILNATRIRGGKQWSHG